MLNFHRERWNPVKKHLKALVFFEVSKQIPIVYSADRGRAETRIGLIDLNIFNCFNIYMYKQKGPAINSFNISYGP